MLESDDKKEDINSCIDNFKTATKMFCIQPILQKTNVTSVLLREKDSNTCKTTFSVQELIGSIQSCYDDENDNLLTQQCGLDLAACDDSETIVDPSTKIRRRPNRYEGAVATVGMGRDNSLQFWPTEKN